MSVETLFEASKKSGDHVFMWTFTFRECLSVQDAFKAWNQFSKNLWKYGIHPKTKEQTIVGLRVAEMHPGGHGVHFHVLINRRIPIQAVRRWAEMAGMFWIHVTRCYHGHLGKYLGKYLGKQDRVPCLKGRRLWQGFGQWGQTKCKDIVVDSEFCTAFQKRRQMLLAAQEIARLQGAAYRMESNLETMHWSEEWVWQVRIGRAVPLRPDLVSYNDVSPSSEDRADFEDWQGVFDSLGRFGKVPAKVVWN